MKDIVWGMIGCGDVTEVKNGPGLYLCEHSRLKGITNRTRSKAQSWVERHQQGIVYGSVEELLSDPEIDIVYIATTPDTHTYFALMCAAAGKHCLLEKPVAPTYEEGLKIQKAFRESGKYCYVAFYRRQLNRFRRLQELVNSGRIGEVASIQIQRSTSMPQDPQAWRARPDICGGDLFTETDIHALDILVMLMGSVADYAYTKSKTGYSVSFVFDSGKIASGLWNYHSSVESDRFEILGSAGRIELNFFQNTAPIRIWDAQGYEELVVEDSPHVGMAMEQAIVNELRGEGHFSGTIEEALESLKVSTGVYYGDPSLKVEKLK